MIGQGITHLQAGVIVVELGIIAAALVLAGIFGRR